MADIPVPDTPERPPPGGGNVLLRLQPLLTLVIALAAIGLAIWEGSENRRHNRLSVQPRLGASVVSGEDAAGEFVRMAVESTGLGPAVVNTFRIYVDGIAQDSTITAGGTPWVHVTEMFSADDTEINARGYGRGNYFPAGREYILFEVKRHREAAAGGEPLTETVGRVAVQICYCSIYNTDCEEVLLATVAMEALACDQ